MGFLCPMLLGGSVGKSMLMTNIREGMGGDGMGGKRGKRRDKHISMLMTNIRGRGNI